jgi:hypothetical protein
MSDGNGEIFITGDDPEYEKIARDVIEWCFDEDVVCRREIDIHVEMCKYSTYDCWGSIIESESSWSMTSWEMTVATDQSPRDFVATIMHEMVHVNQYITDTWKDDGEEECEERQYDLADRFITCNLI